MKNINKWLMVVAGAAMLTSCADVFDTNSYVVSRPGTDAQYDYLKDYKPLKEYNTNPNFKVSAALTASKFIEKGELYALAMTNFDEIVAGNAMKMSSCVDEKGNMSFDNVTSFINTAESAGLTVYGHTLLWHSQQPVKWLRSLIADRKREGVTEEKEYILQLDFSDDSQLLGGWGNNSSRAIVDGVMVFSNPSAANYWEAQAARDFDKPLEEGTYSLMMKVRSDATGLLRVGFQDPSNYGSCGDFKNIELSPAWTEVALQTDVVGSNAKRFIFSFGDVAGDIEIDDLVLYKGELPEYEVTEYINRDFSDASQLFGGWGNGSSQKVEDGAEVLSNPSVVNSWEAQAAIDFPTPLPDGETMILEIRAKASAPYSLGAGFQDFENGYAGCGNFPAIDLTTEYQDFVVKTKVAGENAKRFLFSYGNFAGEIYIDNIKMYTKKEKTAQAEETVITTIYDRDFSDEGQKIGGWGNGSTQEVVDGVQVFTNTSAVNSWEAQAAIDGNAIASGVKAILKIRAKATSNYSLGIGFQNPENYAGCGNFPAIDLTTEYQDFEVKTTVSGENAKRFIFSFGNFVGSIYIDNLTLMTEEVRSLSPLIPLTPEEKRDTAIWAMNRWMNGMMQATQGKVKAWDLINESIAGKGSVGDGGYYDLQHFEGFEQGTWDVGGDNFFWQDCLGAEMYAVYASKAAREAYAAVEGTNPEDLKLFINDYNLEATWDDNKKMESLLYWIDVWEKNGATIDGIGTQMHISYYLDENSQKKQKECITRMFEKMAGSGKLCRISELDMGIYDKQFGNKVENITFEQEKAMADYYKWIIEEYLRIIPADKQYGICQWCITDAPAGDSNWRAGEPVGLWYQDYTRKPAYAGWAEGLK